MNPNDLGWLERIENKPPRRQENMIELEVTPVEQGVFQVQTPQETREMRQFVHEEKRPGRIPGLVREFMEKSVGITSENAMYGFYVGGVGDFTLLRDGELEYITSDAIEEYKAANGINQNSTAFTYGEIIQVPEIRTSILFLKGENSMLSIQYRDAGNGITEIKVYVSIGNRVFSDNARVLGGITGF